MNESVMIKDGRHILRMGRHLAHPVEKVWRAIADAGRASPRVQGESR